MSEPTPPVAPPANTASAIDTIRPQGGDSETQGLVIIKLPQSLAQRQSPITVRGEVIEQTPDGTLRIKTPQGEILAKPPQQSSTVQIGDRVEIRLPPTTIQVQPQPSLPQPLPQTSAPLEIPRLPENAPPPLNTTPQQIVPVRILPPQPPSALVKQPAQEITTTEIITTLSIQENIAPPIPLRQITTLPPIPIKYLPAAELSRILPAPPLFTEISSALDLALDDVVFQTPLPPPDYDVPVTLPHLLTNQPPVTSERIFQPIAETPLIKITTTLHISEISFKPALPLRTVLPALLARPLEQPISAAKDGTSAPQPFQALHFVQVQDVSLPRLQISFEDLTTSRPPSNQKDSLPPAQGNIIDTTIPTLKAQIIGLTPEQNFPIIKITHSPTRQDQVFVLQQPISEATIGQELILRPHYTTADEIPRPLPPEEISPAPISTQSSTTPSTNTHSANPINQPLIHIPQLSIIGTWDTLQEISTLLTQISPPQAKLFSSIIPQANAPHSIPPAALFFWAALRGGDITNLLGEKTIDTIKKAGKGDILLRLGREIAALSRAQSEPIVQDWRMTNIPLAWQNEIHKTVVYYKRSDQETQQEQNSRANGTKTRFLMNLNLSKIGELQVDGLFQKQKDSASRLDLIVRSKTPFSAPMQAEMRRLYKETLDETHFGGELSFQHKPEQWVHITPDAKSAYSKKV